VSERRERDGDGNRGSRLAELKRKVERATKLISMLRETNYSLTGELAELQRRVAAFEAGEASGEAQGAPPPPPAAPGPTSREDELQALRDERKIIRARVQSLLDRIEKLEL
jgi:hypothetical protein